MKISRLLPILFFAAACWPAAHAQRPTAANTTTPGTDQPWPRVGFQLLIDTTQAISGMAQGTAAPNINRGNAESGDIVTGIENAGDGSNRLFIVERTGRIWVMQDGKLLATPFLDISNLTTIDGERGLFGLAFPPGYKSKNHFYVFYTATTGDLTLARYQVDPAKPNQAIAGSGEIVMTVEHREYQNHNGGQIHFGSDGMLYWGTGDGGSLLGDPHNNGQNLKVGLAKMLRLDVEAKPDEGKKYHVPADNPFLKTPGALPEIWALGVRNPFRFCFDPLNGDLYIGNVGHDNWEQIYWASGQSKGGENYGWSMYEGTHAAFPINNGRDTKPPQPSGTPDRGVTFPVAEFGHDTSPNAATAPFKCIIGGVVYRGHDLPTWDGVYFFSDWTHSQIWAMRREDGQWRTQQVDAGKSPVKGAVAFGADEKGHLYVASFADGKIYQLIERPADN